MLTLITNNLAAVLIIVLIALFFLLIWLAYLTSKVSKYVREKEAFLTKAKKKGLEAVLGDYLKQISEAKSDIKKLYSLSEELGKIAAVSVTKVGLVRFNPFSDAGGDQSFSIALLDSKDNGIVVSSLHGREGTRVYSKPIKAGESEYNLTEEERKAIGKAQMQGK
jgi:hypothetical protein